MRVQRVKYHLLKLQLKCRLTKGNKRFHLQNKSNKFSLINKYLHPKGFLPRNLKTNPQKMSHQRATTNKFQTKRKDIQANVGRMLQVNKI